MQTVGSCSLLPEVPAGSPLQGSPSPAPPQCPLRPPRGPPALLWAGPRAFRRGCVTGTAWTLGTAGAPSWAVPLGGAHGHRRPVVRLPALPRVLTSDGDTLRLPRSWRLILTCSHSGLRDALVAWLCCEVLVGLGGPPLPSCKMA